MSVGADLNVGWVLTVMARYLLNLEDLVRFVLALVSHLCSLALRSFIEEIVKALLVCVLVFLNLNHGRGR